MKRVLVALISLTLMHAAIVGRGAIQFEEIAAKAGVRFELKNSAQGAFRLIELMPGGVAALDYDNDGCSDLYFTNGAALPSLEKTAPEFFNRLYRGDCKGHFTDVTARAGVGGSGYSMAVAVGDFDNDGYADLFVAGVNRNSLFRNRRDGTFEDVTVKARLDGVNPKLGKMWSIAAGWIDADQDGLLDLFVSNYVAWDPRSEPKCGSEGARLYCHPNQYQGRPHQLFHNNGDGTFTDISESSGVGGLLGKGMGVAFADYDRDGRPDIYVANDSMRNFLFRNLGKGKFEEVGLETGASLPEGGRAIASMGVDFRDLDNDGRPDVVVTGMINDAYLLFHNLGKPSWFEDATVPSGLARATRQLTGWGMGAFDLDNDGLKDLFFANGHFPQLGRMIGSSEPLAPTVLRNGGDLKFQSVPAGLISRALYRGAAFADFDNDGLVDVAVSAIGTNARIFRNATVAPGHWLAFRLHGSRSNSMGLGAEITVVLDKVTLMNSATTSVGYASSSEAIVRFGLGDATDVKRIEVRWPRGPEAGAHIQLVKPTGIDRVVDVREPQ